MWFVWQDFTVKHSHKEEREQQREAGQRWVVGWINLEMGKHTSRPGSWCGSSSRTERDNRET